MKENLRRLGSFLDYVVPVMVSAIGTALSLSGGLYNAFVAEQKEIGIAIICFALTAGFIYDGVINLKRI